MLSLHPASLSHNLHGQVKTATRAEAALIGALCADAAAQTSHWNYDKDKWHAILKAEVTAIITNTANTDVWL